MPLSRAVPLDAGLLDRVPLRGRGAAWLRTVGRTVAALEQRGRVQAVVNIERDRLGWQSVIANIVIGCGVAYALVREIINGWIARLALTLSISVLPTLWGRA